MQDFKSYRLIANNYDFYLHLAVPDRFWFRVKQFSPKESPLLSVMGAFPAIEISITPSIMIKKEMASSLALKIISFWQYLSVLKL
jgi:hypothetical protein